MSGLETRSNFEILTDCLSLAIVNAITQRNLKNKTSSVKGSSKTKGKGTKVNNIDNEENDAQVEAEELQDFIQYLVTELWEVIPEQIRTVSYDKKVADTSETVGTIESCQVVLNSLPVSFSESLIQAEMVEDEDDVIKLATRTLEAYLDATCAPPQKWVGSKTDECEMCGRNVPLTYHHLIPRSTHAKVLKKGLHPEHMLNRVAWICRPCHNTVHHIADNFELAKDWYTIDKLMGREDIQRWASYISKRAGKTKVR